LAVRQQDGDGVIAGRRIRLQQGCRLNGVTCADWRIFATNLPLALYMPGETCVDRPGLQSSRSLNEELSADKKFTAAGWRSGQWPEGEHDLAQPVRFSG